MKFLPLLIIGCASTSRVDDLEYQLQTHIIDCELDAKMNRLEVALKDGEVDSCEAYWMKVMYRENARTKKMGL